MIEPVHTAVKGRARFRVEGLLRSQALKTYLELRLAQRREVISVRANPLSACVLVHFNSGHDPARIAALIERTVAEYREHLERLRDSHYLAGLSQPSSRQGGPSGLGERIAGLILRSEEQRSLPWHLAEPGAVLAHFGSSRQAGLSATAARERLARYGPNVLPQAAPPSRLSILLAQFRSLPVALLGAAAGLSLLTGGLADALVILGVVGVNAAIGYWTESRAAEVIHSLRSLVRPTAAVLRGGALREVGADEVVLGDVLVLKPGAYVAADSRLLEAHHLSVDESILTGESLPAAKSGRTLVDARAPLAERANMAYMGTLVVGGHGLAVVVATGRFTEIGKLQALVGEAAPPVTPMERQLAHLGNQLVAISSAVCALVFLVGLLRGQGLLAMLRTAASLAVAAVPEGLPTVATTTLALGVAEMRRRHVLVRRLEAVGTLGCVQTICFDKTGTITHNRMSVVRLHCGGRRLTVSDGRIRDAAGEVNPYAVDELLRLIHAGVLCNESEIDGAEEGRYILKGSSTENALLLLALGAGVDARALRERYPLVEIHYRSESRNYMRTVHRPPEGGRLTAIKGSPTEVLALCRLQVAGGGQVPLGDEDREAILAENERLAAQALRVLGVAYALEDGGTPPPGYVWLGLIGMADQVRRGVAEVVRRFHGAGIATVMITGDQSPTAFAVGRELDLSHGAPLEIFESTALPEVDPSLMRALAERVHVFSRVSPAHKLQIVQALQRAGRVVAMTGDGVNDGPALKAADIGVAMGHGGTDIAREVADVVLETDELETMLVAIGRSRAIYNNIRKSIRFLLSTNLSETMVVFSALSLGAGQPLSPMQLLWINMISDIFPGLALALEPPEPDVLSRPPRDPARPIISGADLKRAGLESATISAGALAAYGYGLARYGLGARAGTLAFHGLTCAQLLHAASCRSEAPCVFAERRLAPNPYLTAALAGSLLLQGLAAFVPGLRRLLNLAPLGLADGAAAAAAAVAPLMVNERTKPRQGRGEP